NQMVFLSCSFFTGDQYTLQLARESDAQNHVFILKIWSSSFASRFERLDLGEFLDRYKGTEAVQGLTAMIGSLATAPFWSFGLLAISRGWTHRWAPMTGASLSFRLG